MMAHDADAVLFDDMLALALAQSASTSVPRPEIKELLLARLESTFGKSPSWGSSIRSRL